MENNGDARQATDDNIHIIRSMHIACLINKSTDTYSSYFLMFFPLQQWLRERVSILRSTYVVRFVTFCVMTAHIFIVTLVTHRRTRTAMAERDATFGTLHWQLQHIVR